jgi:uncharacterized membrane protein
MKRPVEKRPELNIPVSVAGRLTEAACGGLLLAMVIASMMVYTSLPEAVPMHFDASGNVTKTGAPASFLGLPFLALLLFVVLSWLQTKPHWYNYAEAVTVENAFSIYSSGVRFMRGIKCFIVALFSLIQWQIWSTSTGGAQLPHWIIAVSAAVVPPILVVLFFLPAWRRSKEAKKQR